MEELVHLVALADGEKLLIQTFRTGAWYADYAKMDGDGEKYYEFGELYVLNLGTFCQERHTILVYPSDDWEEETDEGTVLFTDMADGMLRIELPWGNEHFQYPLQETLVVRCNKRV